MPSHRQTPDIRQLITALWSLGEGEQLPATLLGIGPMSPNAIQAALEAGRDGDFPVIFIASRNQIDASQFGGGYVRGWDQQAFVAAIGHIAQQIDFTGLYYVCRDHGGPWQRDEERTAQLPVDEAMGRAMASYRADIDAGFDLLHIDPTKTPFAAGTPDLEVVAERVVELISGCEQYRTQTGAGSISYEVGTEETSGGLTSPENFEAFIIDLLRRLDAAALPHPLFIVGQTGTLLKMRQNIGRYDAASARVLSQIARRHDLAFKEHNSDYLPADNLAQHPAWGITAANLAPCFGHAETAAYWQLAEQEAQTVARPSNFRVALAQAAFASHRWRKWLLPKHEHLDETAICSDPELLDDITYTAGHYVFDEPQVAAARRQMYENLAQAGCGEDAHRFVLDRIKDCIREYAQPLGLMGITSRLREVVE